MRILPLSIGSICQFLLVLVIISCQPIQQDVRRPNILVFLADDWSWPHAGIYGDSLVSTPHFDRMAKFGALFHNAYCAAPSCTPSRAALLTGMYPHQLQEGVNLWGFLPAGYPNYTVLMEQEGYLVGYERKGWGPGNEQAGGYARNPAGNKYKDFFAFYDSLKSGQPFCFWFGSKDPHRPYEHADSLSNGTKYTDVVAPGFLPNVQEVQQDMINYYAEVERFDQEVGDIVQFLKEKGELSNTLIIVTSDNGMPFPRAKATVYDAGSKMPMLMYWPGKLKPQQISSFVNQIDVAPTFLEAVGIPIPDQMTGRSLWPILDGLATKHRDSVFLERERHAYVRAGNQSYPIRSIRTADFLYIQNLYHEQWPAGDPNLVFAVGPFGDVDGSPSKQYLIDHQSDRSTTSYFQRALGKRPFEELYHLRSDPDQLLNVAEEERFQSAKDRLRGYLNEWQKETKDPRLRDDWPTLQDYPYYGRSAKKK
ncbi:MAG: sulfatase [Cyclobacteriaceae bacterium]|nr:sulfatase [Cyclobacteriaceae bacterium HetDA_MAG_MS6]